MRRNNDKMLLESLIRKYGKNSIKNAIKKINESLTHHDHMELEQIIEALINNNEKLNTLLDSAGNPTPRLQRILSVYDEYVLDVFYELVDADGVDSSYIVECIGRMAEDNEWENGTEASMIVNFLTDIADEINVNINESVNNVISEEYVSGVDNIWLCVDANGSEKMFSNKDPYAKGPQKSRKSWQYKYANMTYLPNGTIKKLIGYDLTWEDEPVEYSHK